MKRFILPCLFFCLITPVSIEAKKKSFGNGLFWELTSDGTLTISGNGEMPDFEWEYKENYYITPWHKHMRKKEILKVVICEGITYIGEGAFSPNPSGSNSSISQVVFPLSLKRIGSWSFRSVNIKNLVLSEGLEQIDDYAFYKAKFRTIDLPLSIKKVGYEMFGEFASFKGDIIKLPACLVQDLLQKDKDANPEFPPCLYYGISEESWCAYKNGIKDSNGRILFSAKNREISIVINKGNIPYYIINENGETGIMNCEAKWIIHKGVYQSLKPFANYYLKARKGYYYAILTFDGIEVIPMSRGYTSIGDYDKNKDAFAFTKKGYSGLCDLQGQEISLTKLAPTLDEIKDEGGYSNVVELKNNNSKYYIVGKGNRYGLTNYEGNIIVPVELEDLGTAGAGYLKYKLNGFWGLMDFSGKILIDTDRGYTSIGDFVSFTKRFPYTMLGYKGECDATGKQLSKIKVEAPQQNVASSSSSSTSSSTSRTGTTQTVVVEHHRDPIPMQEWQACFGCGGMGTMGCHSCGGSGTKYIGDRLHRCGLCNGRGIIPCNVCYGNKGKYITVYK